MQLHLALIALCFIALSEQQICKVYKNCGNGKVTWADPPQNGAKGQKGEPEVTHQGPTLHFLGNTMTYNTGRGFCELMNKRLCASEEICHYNNEDQTIAELRFDVLPGDHWTPVLDSDNEWIEIGDSARRTCLRHSIGGKPDWGLTTVSHQWKGFTYCCEISPDMPYKAILYQYIGKTATYASSENHCISQHRRLCRSDEICKNNIPIFGVVGGDMWVAIKKEGSDNEWLQAGNGYDKTCWVHGERMGPATWGTRTDGSPLDFVGLVYCC